jgi:LmbE family N-acetylglucosaminyl deacetylase
MRIQGNNRILILAPHTDDGELGCGGTISRLVKEKNEVYYIAFSAAEKSVSPEYPNNILRKEVEKATSILGISGDKLKVLNFEVRDFPKNRQEILDYMIVTQNSIQPDIVFMPTTTDTHQDHQTIFEEGFRSFKKSTILGYELPWNNLYFNTDCFITLNEENIIDKVSALKQYESQSNRLYANENFIKSLASVRGTQIGVKYAEAFQVIRIVI